MQVTIKDIARECGVSVATVSINISALIWAKSLEKYTDEEKKKLNDAMLQLDVPVMTMDNYGFACEGTDVVFDYRQGGYIATKHLIDYGHRRIGCVAGKKNYQVTQERLEGYKMALQEAGISYDEKLVVYGDYTMNSGYMLFSYVMGKKVTAVQDKIMKIIVEGFLGSNC